MRVTIHDTENHTESYNGIREVVMHQRGCIHLSGEDDQPIGSRFVRSGASVAVTWTPDDGPEAPTDAAGCEGI